MYPVFKAPHLEMNNKKDALFFLMHSQRIYGSKILHDKSKDQIPILYSL